VLHLALAPADVAACRARLPFRHVLLAFRDAAHAWPAWRAAIEHPDWLPEPLVGDVRVWLTADGFTIVWIVLAP